MLSIGVAAFFLAYDHIAHRGMPALSDSPKSTMVVARPLAVPGYSRIAEPPTPDMNSAEVKFASADVLQANNTIAPKTVDPLKPQIKLTVEPKQKAGIQKAKSHSSQPTRLARVKVRSQGRAAYAQGYSPGFGMFRQF
jgi:hypothetical protein